MLIKIYDDNPNPAKVKEIVDCLKGGGVIIYPTDTVYGLGCDIFNAKAVERICQIKGIKADKSKLSFVCHDFSHLSDYAKQFDKAVYKMLNKHLPGPFTFILNANNSVPKLFKSSKKTVGIRVPDNKIAQTIVRELGRPILSTSLKMKNAEDEYPSHPELIYEEWGKQVDIVIDGGVISNQVSTVVDYTGDEPEIIRQGAGELIY